MKLDIIKFDHFGRGIGKNNNQVIFINGALPNEQVLANITNKKKKYCEGKIDKIIKKSDKRILSICPFYGKCSGCHFLHTTYEEEKKFKINKAIELLGKCDHFYETKGMNYRNKITLHVSNNSLGYYEEKSHKIVPINYCYLVSNGINKVINDFKNFNLDSTKEIIIKENNGKLLLDIKGNIKKEDLLKLDYVDSIIANKKVIKGNGYLEEIIANKTFKITSEAFFQVNKEGLENIYYIISNYLKDKKINKMLDLYSGTSLWGILLSDFISDIVGIEINKEACLNAVDNIKKNNIYNIRVINGKVEDYINTFQKIDLCIVDPPRSGLDNKTKDYLKKISSKYLIYISCDMQTLRRDLNDLKDVYNVSEVNLVDMFKRTYHCEVVAILERK